MHIVSLELCVLTYVRINSLANRNYVAIQLTLLVASCVFCSSYLLHDVKFSTSFQLYFTDMKIRSYDMKAVVSTLE